MSLITELPTSHHLAKGSAEIPQVGSDRKWVFQRPPSPTATSTLKQEENSVSEIKDDVDDSVTEKPSIFDTWVASAKLQEAAQQLGTTTNSNTSITNHTSSTNSNENQHSKRPHNKLGQYKLGKGTSKVRLVGDPNVDALEARVAERRAADKIRDEKIRKKIHDMFVERLHREAERAEAKKAEAEAAHQAKQEEIRRKHEEHLAAEEARKVRCSKLLKCDMDIIEGKKSVVARFEGRKAELKKKEEEDLLIAKWQRHETCATGKGFYEKLHEHEVTVKRKAEADALDRTTSRKLDIAPLPLEYRNKVRDQFLRLESQRKTELLASTHGSDLNMTVTQGKRDNMIQYAKAVQREILPTLQTVPMVIEDDKKKTVPREPLTAEDRRREGNMAIHHHPSTSASTSPSSTPMQTCLAHSKARSPSSTPSQLAL